jgi:hypothetical protein
MITEILYEVSKGDYTYAKVKYHPNATENNYVLMHRVVVENHIGRYLTADEIVHHKNEDKKDNDIANLELMTNAEHARLHATTGRTLIKLICPECDKEFERERRCTHLVKGGTQTFCSRSCNGRYQRALQLK